MWSSQPIIASGDTVIVWLKRDSLLPLVVEPGKVFNSKYGNYPHSALVGLPYGSKLAAPVGRGFIHVLRPTPELWTLALPHRTQILYLADIALISSWLNLCPGSVVIEAGTGSGSFSHSVARTISPAGHLYSYEFHETRAAKARAEFEQHGLLDTTITLTHRNVCKDGFTVVDAADAVFLDLPAPWDAIEHAKRALRKDVITRICCFSPCMEQVLRTVSALNEHGFTDITMYETLLRPQEVTPTPHLRSVDDLGSVLREAENKREEKRAKQIAQSRATALQGAKNNNSTGGGKRKRGHRNGDGNVTASSTDGDASAFTTTAATVAGTSAVGERDDDAPQDGQEHGQGANGGDEADINIKNKRARTMADQQQDEESGRQVVAPPPSSSSTDVVMVTDGQLIAATTATTATTTTTTNIIDYNTIGGVLGREATPTNDEPINLTKVLSEVRGHTSYLTFAILLPASHAPSPSPLPSRSASVPVVAEQIPIKVEVKTEQ